MCDARSIIAGRSPARRRRVMQIPRSQPRAKSQVTSASFQCRAGLPYAPQLSLAARAAALSAKGPSSSAANVSTMLQMKGAVGTPAATPRMYSVP